MKLGRKRLEKEFFLFIMSCIRLTSKEYYIFQLRQTNYFFVL